MIGAQFHSGPRRSYAIAMAKPEEQSKNKVHHLIATKPTHACRSVGKTISELM